MKGKAMGDHSLWQSPLPCAGAPKTGTFQFLFPRNGPAAPAPWADFSSCFPPEARERPFQGCIVCNVICECKRWGLMTYWIWGDGAWRSFFTSSFLGTRLSTDGTLSIFIEVNRKGLCPQRPSCFFSQLVGKTQPRASARAVQPQEPQLQPFPQRRGFN